MIVQYASDLHLEFPENKEFLKKRPIKPRGDVMILAGDILPFRLINEHSDFFDYLSDRFEATFWVPGNHEYYHSDISKRSGSLKENIRKNVSIVNNTMVRKGKVNFVFSTLWTRISPEHRLEIQIRYSDFQVIRNRGKLYNIDHYNNMHDRCLTFLRNELKSEKKGPVIVASHHMPTFINYPEEYRGDPLNEAFAAELSDLILASQPAYWIFGHHHSNKKDFTIGKTRLVTNQLGYVSYHEQEGFNEGKIIVI